MNADHDNAFLGVLVAILLAGAGDCGRRAMTALRELVTFFACYFVFALFAACLCAVITDALFGVPLP